MNPVTGRRVGQRGTRCGVIAPSILVLSLCVTLLGGARAGAADAARPNVVLIVTDDQGAADAGCYGAKDLQTPAIDALAGRGVRFTQFYAAAPVCSPSRAGLLTGRYPLRAGLVSNAGSQPGQAGMPAEQVTLAEMFKAAGYATCHVGKWHLGYRPVEMPNGQGFDHSFGHMGGCIDNYSHFFYWAGPNRHDLFRDGQEVYYPGRYFPDLMVEEAGGWLERNSDRPFFLYFALNMPHYPYQGEAKWLDRYRDLPYPRNLYAAFLSTCDERIGRLLAKLDDLKVRENTIVVLQSDNGHSTEERAHFGGGSAGPYRGAKFSLFEGGIRLPGMISWPGRLPAGAVRGQVVHACDWMPTLAELTGVPLVNPDIDGKSLVPVLRSADAATPHDVLHWYVDGGANAQWAVRQGDWKLIGNVRSATNDQVKEADRKLFLSNLGTDVSEKVNLAADHPDVVQRLKKLHDDWLSANAAGGAKPRRSADDKGDER
jgi:arylsulfatase A-like enzyme